MCREKFPFAILKESMALSEVEEFLQFFTVTSGRNSLTRAVTNEFTASSSSIRLIVSIHVVAAVD